MWPTYEAYCEEMERLGTEPLSEEIWRREYAPKDEPYRESLIITPKNKTRPMSATLENHISHDGQKKLQPKKKYAPKQCRKGWTPDQIKARNAENVRNHRARKKLTGVIA